jgi:glycosyltransferase involved in cell wall biosynthesis
MRVWLLQRAEPTPHDDAGSHRACRTGIMAKMLAHQGHEVVWWTSSFDHVNRCHRFATNTRKPVENNYEVQYLRGCGYKKNISFARMRDNVAVAEQFSRLAHSDPLKPDIIVASIPTAELALEGTHYANHYNIPIFLDIRDLWPDMFVDLMPTALKPAVKLLSLPMKQRLKQACRSATGIIGLTDAFVEWGVQYANRQRLDIDRVFPMGYLSSDICETEIKQARQFWQKMGISKSSNTNELIVVFFGALGKTNDLFPVIDACKILEARHIPVKVIICGDGPMASDLAKQAEGISNLFLPGWIYANQIRALLEIADVGIAPYINSYNYTANIPNKPPEYLSRGLIIALSLNDGSLYQLISEKQCGFSYNNDSDILANKLEYLVNNPSQVLNMKANSLNTFNELFDGELVYKKLIEFMEEIVFS